MGRKERQYFKIQLMWKGELKIRQKYGCRTGGENPATCSSPLEYLKKLKLQKRGNLPNQCNAR
jgi:hypothetical protein